MQPVDQVPQASRPQEKRKLSVAIAQSVHKIRYVLWAVLIAGAVVLVGYLVWTEVAKKRLVDSTLLAEAATELFDAWSGEQDAAKKAELQKDLEGRLDSLVSRYPRQYGGQRGLFLRADLNFGLAAWQKARADFEEVARLFPASYLSAVSLFNAGVCAEEMGEADAAQSLYLQVAEKYADSAAAPRALFDAGRLDEQKAAWDDARKRYEKLESDFAASLWTQLAKNRLIALKVEGKLK